MDTLVVITGPTAVGKTALTMQLAQHYGVPVINADSRQIYRELKIGTAAPTAEQQQLVKHYFVGTKSIDDYYNASMYEQEVLELLDAERSTFHVLSGGSMMYIDAVCNGIDDIPTVRDDIREEMKRRYAEEGLEALCEDLRRLDPEHYAIVDRQNHRRVIHALEICYQTERTYTSFRTQQKKERPFRIVKIGLNRDREELYNRINQRVDQMMEDGLLDEVKSLVNKRNTNVERIKGNTRRYARKQLTWYKRDADMRWFHPDNIEEILNYLTQYEKVH